MTNPIYGHLHRGSAPSRNEFISSGIKMGFAQTLKNSHSLVDSVSGILRFVNELERADPELVRPVKREVCALEQLHTYHTEAVEALENSQLPTISLGEYLGRLYDFWYHFITTWNHLLTQLEARYCPFTAMREHR